MVEGEDLAYGLLVPRLLPLPSQLALSQAPPAVSAWADKDQSIILYARALGAVLASRTEQNAPHDTHWCQPFNIVRSRWWTRNTRFSRDRSLRAMFASKLS